MRVDVLEVVTRGAAPGTRRCDACRCPAPELWECRIRWGSDGSRPIQGFWYDLCSECRSALEKLPPLPGERRQAEVLLDRARERLRDRPGGVSRGGGDVDTARSAGSLAGQGTPAD